MSVKRAFFGIFQKLTLFCCAMFFGFANAFSANLPSGYTELEYIESTGTQWIDTGVSGAATWNITAQSESFTTTGNKVLVARGSNGPTWFGAVKDTGNFGAGATASSSVSYTTKADMVINFASDSISGTINGEGFNRTGSATAFNNNYELFGFDGNYLFIGKLFVAKAYQNNTLVRNLIPAKNSSGVVGLYDTVNNRFYTNAGTGTFTAGPVVCSNGELAQIYTSATGTVTQSGTPTPTNPIEPTFYQQGYLVLRKINDTYADSYDATTGKITRRVGVKVLNGTENWFMSGDNYLAGMYNILINDMYAEASSVSSNRASPYSTHFGRSTSWLGYSGTSRLNKVQAYTTTDNTKHILGLGYPGAAESNISAFKQWLAQQYAAGTPVVVYYPLVTPVEENWAPEQCLNGIKIATTAYNAARFNSVQTDLDNAVATIREIVTKTINQTAAIASLQADKQTRPEDACPAGKKCLLVETEENGVIVPHWFPIVENICGVPSGYNCLDYIQSDGNSWIDTGITPRSTKLQVNFKMQSLANTYQSFFGSVADPSPRNGYRIYRQEGGSFFVQSGSENPSVAVNFNNPLECQTTVNNGGRATVVVNGVTSTVGSGMNTQFDRSMLIFTTALGSGDSISGTGAFKLWSFQIIKDDEEKFNGVPAKRNSDGAIGLYDTVTNTFFINKGTGTFTAGPEI